MQNRFNKTLINKFSQKNKDDSSDSDSESDVEDLRRFREDPKETAKKNDTCCKKILRFFFSFVGLFILLAAYTVGGELVLALIHCGKE